MVTPSPDRVTTIGPLSGPQGLERDGRFVDRATASEGDVSDRAGRTAGRASGWSR
jgi:hypothetical protein